VVYGHGLWGNRRLAWPVAWSLCPRGFAVVAIDAPKHGEHPDEAEVNEAISLFGITGDPRDPFVPLPARDNFRQATYDKLQLLRRIEHGMDLDADGSTDLDADEVHYVGESLGAVMAPQFLAYAPHVRSATLVVGGARLTEIVAHAEQFTPLVVAVTPELSRTGRLRFLAVSQSALDRGEPEVFAAHVLADRIPGFDAGIRPHVLAHMAIGDDIVPNSSTAYLARALRIPLAGDVAWPIRGIEVEGALPTTGNLARGHTAALVQFEHVLGDRGRPDQVPATHGNVQNDPLAVVQRTIFVETADNLAGATIVDPLDP
jgi:pimeloyl-ACP methyl ester carboxylesterase